MCSRWQARSVSKCKKKQRTQLEVPEVCVFRQLLLKKRRRFLLRQSEVLRSARRRWESWKTWGFHRSFPFIGGEAGQVLRGRGAVTAKFSFTSPADVTASQKRLISLSFTLRRLTQRIKVHPQSECAPSDQELRRFP